jgi:hypothetical protein
MTDNDNNTTTNTSEWKTTTSSVSTSSPVPQPDNQPQRHKHQELKPSRRPTDPLDEFFYEQAKFFRHLERKYERFNHKSKEDEKYARAGKFKHKSKPKNQQQQVPQRQNQNRHHTKLIGPVTELQSHHQDENKKASSSIAKGEIQKETKR